MSSLPSDLWIAPQPDGVQQLLFSNSLRLPLVALSKQLLCIMLHVSVVRRVAYHKSSSLGTDGVGVDVIMVPAWMLCVNGWGRGGHYYGYGMDALRERMGWGWTFLRFRHGCSA